MVKALISLVNGGVGNVLVLSVVLLHAPSVPPLEVAPVVRALSQFLDENVMTLEPGGFWA